MDATASNNRQVRGADLVRAKQRGIRPIAGDTYAVPSATGSGSYIVDLACGSCTCPDHADNGTPVCKHMWAVRFFRHEVEMPDGTFEAVFEVFSAKKAAERAPGVGEKSDLVVLRDGKIMWAPEDLLGELDKLYAERTTSRGKVSVAEVKEFFLQEAQR